MSKFFTDYLHETKVQGVQGLYCFFYEKNVSIPKQNNSNWGSMSCGLTPHVFVPLGQLLLPLLLKLLAVHYLPTLRSKMRNLL